jgi:hypothetical protein
MAANAPHWCAFTEMMQPFYMDYKHPNYKGRAFYTRELAAWIVAGGDPEKVEPAKLGPLSYEKPVR